MDGLIGKSKTMQKTREMIQRFAALNVNALITGESGTGKGLAARALHENGPRAGAPFIRFHCASLCGEDKGGSWPFDPAALRGGTLFLDELCDLSPPAQRRLMGLMESQEMALAGADGVRIISSGQPVLAAMTHGGGFREDLHFRLNGVAIALPPLRERKEDIPFLTTHFLAKIAARKGEGVKSLSKEAARMFQNHPWSGNVRELKNILEHAAALCYKDTILPEHLPDGFSRASGFRNFSSPASLSRLDILEALEKTRWHKTQAAQWLGMSRSTFYRKVKELNVT